MNAIYFAVFGLSLLLSFVLSERIRGIWTSRRPSALPGSHYQRAFPLPPLGSTSVYLSFVLSIAAASFLTRIFPTLMQRSSLKSLPSILLAGTLVFALGLYDDFYGLPSPYVKFLVQVASATILFAGGLRIIEIPVLLGARHFGSELAFPITVIWVIGISNAFTIIQESDLLMTGSVLFSTLVVFAIAASRHDGFAMMFAIALSGAILGFLRCNSGPVTMSLGGGGGLFIAFALGALALQSDLKSPTTIAIAIPIVSFGSLVFGVQPSTFRRRIRDNVSLRQKAQNCAKKIIERGLWWQKIAIGLYGASAVIALASVFLFWPAGTRLGLTLAVLAGSVWWVAHQFRLRQSRDVQNACEVVQDKMSQNTAIVRQAVEELNFTRDYSEICRILQSALLTKDFDSFELEAKLLSADYDGSKSLTLLKPAPAIHFRWAKSSSTNLHSSLSTWSLNLELITTNNRRRGSIKMHRRYNQGPLLIDTNYLISVFPIAVADALDRSLGRSEVRGEAQARSKFRFTDLLRGSAVPKNETK